MSYHNNREERLEYQKEYNALYHEKYLEYQRWYYQNVKKPNYVPKKRVKKEKPTKITKTFLKELEKVCLKKIKDYNDTLYQEQQAKKLSNHDKAFEGFVMKNGQFTLLF
jgi:hypothetical protein